MRIYPLTQLQEQILDEIVQRGGLLQHGAIQQIADKLECSRSTISGLLTTDAPGARRFREELDRRLDALPLQDPRRQIAMLQKMLDDVIEKRSKFAPNAPLTGKDPVDIIDAARKITQGEGYLKLLEQRATETPKPAYHNFDDLTDDEVRQAMETIRRAIKQGRLEEAIDGEFTEECPDDAPDAFRLGSGMGGAGGTEGAEASTDAQ